MRRRSKFKKTDVTRATKAVLAAGLGIARVVVALDGSIVIVPGEPAEAIHDANGERNEWDSVHGQPTPALRP